MTESSRETTSPVILVCDDDPNARTIAEGALTALGYRVLEAEDGRQAMDICRHTVPDAIVMDLMMPQVSGTEFLRWLRTLPLKRYVPVLLVTARTDVDHKVEGLESGADDYLTKPYHYRELQARVEALLRIRDLTDELAREKAESQSAAATEPRKKDPTALQNALKQLDALEESLRLNADDATSGEALPLVNAIRAELKRAAKKSQ